mmetsp:Transcript_28482/g.65623  ORF Transcript_28482/g.65623 Transcript_28482/m.65623 type:complete len:332 (-) Transcript_28482:526-1521(-)
MSSCSSWKRSLLSRVETTTRQTSVCSWVQPAPTLPSQTPPCCIVKKSCRRCHYLRGLSFSRPLLIPETCGCPQTSWRQLSLCPPLGLLCSWPSPLFAWLCTQSPTACLSLTILTSKRTSPPTLLPLSLTSRLCCCTLCSRPLRQAEAPTLSGKHSSTSRRLRLACAPASSPPSSCPRSALQTQRPQTVALPRQCWRPSPPSSSSAAWGVPTTSSPSPAPLSVALRSFDTATGATTKEKRKASLETCPRSPSSSWARRTQTVDCRALDPAGTDRARACGPTRTSARARCSRGCSWPTGRLRTWRRCCATCRSSTSSWLSVGWTRSYRTWLGA